MTSPSVTTPPGPGFVAGIAAASGVHAAGEYNLAQLLITHPTPRRAHETAEGIEAGMRRLAAALHLGPGNATPPVIGSRIILWREVTALDYGHDDYVMSIPSPSHEWLRLVRDGAPCRVCLVFAPLSLAADQAETDAHLRASLKRGAVVWGTTYARRRF
ncbi:hypothetical protein ACFWVU_02390 [Streptomyces sp. NPDC058686]|uniref:hypothetical protein n=1 Tax=Streptomyces sp. NPDC058686 TaxID=3346599 RepID=UPI00365CFFE0